MSAVRVEEVGKDWRFIGSTVHELRLNGDVSGLGGDAMFGPYDGASVVENEVNNSSKNEMNAIKVAGTSDWRAIIKP
ncbi:hypothetical protein V6N12_074621 [Hibiscus sabdariffa]|uniref:Uncharacterized protein n=1 Tax=Hibiscus sabdariffa TaxID=183260 RepID=A0ABR2BY20_9ROSI